MNLRPCSALLLAVSELAFLQFLGCSGRTGSVTQSAAEQHAEVASERQELQALPAPTKTRYMSVHSYESWENPYITVQPDMFTVHVLMADPTPNAFGAGGMLRPVGARREDLNLSSDKLGEGLSSIPQSAWPYGRVVAVEEAHNTPAKQEPIVRRNMEFAVSKLNDLGLVAYDLADGNLR